jgi:hypothetical protein
MSAISWRAFQNMLLLFSGYRFDEAFSVALVKLVRESAAPELEHTKNSLQVYFNLDPEGEKLITI